MRIAYALAVVAALAVAAPVAIASADDDEDNYNSAIVTIGNLEAQGYTVNVDRVGSAPLEDCVVTDIRNPQEVTRWVRVGDDNGGWHGDDDEHGWSWLGNNNSELVEVVVKRTITVSLNCSG